jgi:hypothetical protein
MRISAEQRVAGPFVPNMIANVKAREGGHQPRART